MINTASVPMTKIEEWRGSVTRPRSHSECTRAEIQTRAVTLQSLFFPPSTQPGMASWPML